MLANHTAECQVNHRKEGGTEKPTVGGGAPQHVMLIPLDLDTAGARSVVSG